MGQPIIPISTISAINSYNWFKNNQKKPEGNIDKVLPYATTAAGMLNSVIGASRMKTSLPTKMVTSSPFTYTNRSGFYSNRNQANFRNLLNTRTGIPVNTGQALASTVTADNNINIQEAERQDAAIRDFNNRNLQINASNLEAANRNAYISNMLKNSQIAEQTSSYNNFLTGLDVIKKDKLQREADDKAMKYTLAAASVGRGQEFNKALQLALKNLFK